jgi:hypothetical protein
MGVGVGDGVGVGVGVGVAVGEGVGVAVSVLCLPARLDEKKKPVAMMSAIIKSRTLVSKRRWCI